MKKKVAKLLTAIAMLTSSVASLGCVFWISDEPDFIDLFSD